MGIVKIMSKYLIKIVASPLIALIFLLGSNFCWQNILNPVVTQGEPLTQTKASAVVSYNNYNSLAVEIDYCNEGRGDTSSTDFFLLSLAASHHNTILPCCLNEGQPNAVAFTQSLEINKSAPAILFFSQQLLKIVPAISSYHIPIIAPPKLLAVQTTILRL